MSSSHISIFLIVLFLLQAVFVFGSKNCDDKVKTEKCRIGLKCFNKDEKTSECRPACPADWACSKTNNTPFITLEEFNQALINAGYDIPSTEKYEYIVNLSRKVGKIESKRELAMFLAQILWESDGLKAVREYACQEDGCPTEYRTTEDVPGKFYYGRGYIQLTWAGTYKAASYELFNDDRLYKNPDLVAEEEELSWMTAFWYWKKYVKNKPGVELGFFGATTDAVNGLLECFKGPNVEKAKLRFLLYKKIHRSFKIKEEPIEKGCY